MHFHLHIHGNSGGEKADMENIPKGCLAITVGQSEEEQQKNRFVIPVKYVNHPLFAQLLKEAEEEYGFDQDGPIKIPCHVQQFCRIIGVIDRQTTSHHHNHHVHDIHHFHYQHHHFPCFRA